MKNLGFSFALAIALTSARVASMRLNEFFPFARSVHRLLGNGLPRQIDYPVRAINRLFPIPRGRPAPRQATCVLGRPAFFGDRGLRLSNLRVIATAQVAQPARSR